MKHFFLEIGVFFVVFVSVLKLALVGQAGLELT